MTVTGALVMTLYHGPILNGAHQDTAQSGSRHNWAKGTLMLICSCTGWSCFFILQVSFCCSEIIHHHLLNKIVLDHVTDGVVLVLQSFTLKEYPAELSLTSMICMMGMIQGSAASLVMNRNVANAWSIGWDTRLLAPVYSVSKFVLLTLYASLAVHHLISDGHEWNLSRSMSLTSSHFVFLIAWSNHLASSRALP